MLEILVVKPSSLGDIIHGLQVVQSLRLQRPDCRVTWIVREIFAPLVEACEVVDEYIIYYRHGGLKAFWRLLHTIRQKHFDVVLDLQGLARSGLMTGVARCPLKIGRSDAREGASFFYHEKAPLPQERKKAHAIDILRQFLPLLECDTRLSWPLIFKEDSQADFASLIPSRPYLLVFPESRRSEKQWKGFEVLRLLLNKRFPEYTVVFAGNDSSAKKADDLIDADLLIDLRGKSSLRALISLINQSSLVIANDSGPVHLASALLKPVLALFGPTQPQRYGPYPLDQSTNHFLCAPGGNLEKLSVDAVFQTIAKISNVA